MRKTLLFLLIATALFTLAATVASAAPVTAQLARLKGNVMMKASPSADWVTAKEGMKVTEGSAVKCGPDSQVFAVWKDNSIKVGEKSSVTLDNLDEQGDVVNAKINLTEGSVFVKAGKLSKQSNFAVKTPTAIAGVRGTGFEASMIRFAVVEGSISIDAGGVKVEIGVGQLVEISASGVMGEPVVIPPGQMQALMTIFAECKEIALEVAKDEGSQGKAKGKDKEEKEEAKAAKEEAKEESKEAVTEEAPATETAAATTENVTNAVDTVVESTNVVTTTEQATDAATGFLSGNGGLQGTINIQYSY